MIYPVFISGNLKKIEFLEKYLGVNLEHEKINLDEIQSLDLGAVVEHKVRQAYAIMQKPVLVEDVSLEFSSVGRLPGTFIRFFLEELGPLGLCRLLDGKERHAIARCTFGYYDGIEVQFFEGSIEGSISENPKGENGYGWDQVFIPYFADTTSAELSSEEYERFYTEGKPLEKVREFLLSL